MYQRKSRPPLVLNHVAPSGVAHLTPLSYAMFHMSAPPLPRFAPPPVPKPKKIITGVASILELLKNEGKLPASDDNRITKHPEKTLFVARMSYEITEKELETIFSQYGRIRKVRIVCDQQNKPRGYAFVEFEHERDFKEAYKHADGMKIHGRRILVDYERARVDSSWRPRKSGGGKGKTRAAVDPRLKELTRPIGYGNYFKKNRNGPLHYFGLKR